MAAGEGSATPVGGMEEEEEAAPASSSRMSRLLQQGYRGPAAAIAAANKKKGLKPSMTTTDGKSIVATKEAVMAMPMSVTTVMEKADLEKVGPSSHSSPPPLHLCTSAPLLLSSSHSSPLHLCCPLTGQGDHIRGQTEPGTFRCC